MSRYIDIEPYEKDGWYLQRQYHNSYCRVIKTTPLVSVPTAELNSCEYWDSESHFCALRRPQAKSIKHGRWIKNEGRSGWHCSCCGKDNLYAYPYAENNERELQDFYCPNCGAKMDAQEEPTP